MGWKKKGVEGSRSLESTRLVVVTGRGPSRDTAPAFTLGQCPWPISLLPLASCHFRVCLIQKLEGRGEENQQSSPWGIFQQGSPVLPLPKSVRLHLLCFWPDRWQWFLSYYRCGPQAEVSQNKYAFIWPPQHVQPHRWEQPANLLDNSLTPI